MPQGKQPCPAPLPHQDVLNLPGCTRSASVITSLLRVYSQDFLLLHKHNASPLAVPASAACLYIISQSSSHTPLFPTVPPSFLFSFCDLCILSASFGSCCLLCFLLGMFGTKASARELAKKEGVSEGHSKRREMERRHWKQQQSGPCSCGCWQRSSCRFTETILQTIVYMICRKGQMSQRPHFQ